MHRAPIILLRARCPYPPEGTMHRAPTIVMFMASEKSLFVAFRGIKQDKGEFFI